MGVWRVEVTALLYARPCTNVMHFDSGDSDLTEQAVFLEIRDNWVGTVNFVGIHQWHPGNIRWVEIAVQRRTPALGPRVPTPVNITGVQGPSDEEFLQVCTLLRIVTATPGRSGHGRVYLPSCMGGFTTQGVIDDTFTQFASQALEGLRTRFLRSSVNHGPLVIGVAPRANANAFKDATDLLIATRTGTQRRRNRRS